MATSSARADESSRSPAAARQAVALVAALRPAQWVKNLVVPLPFLFGGALAEASSWLLAAEGLLCFCAVSSAIYLLNDVVDRERDQAHPAKRRRPIAAGELSPPVALAASAVLAAAGLGASYALSEAFFLWVAAYAALMTAYSLVLKRVPFLEAFIVAAGLPLRALAGTALAGLPPTTFLMLCAWLLALFLVVGKRQWELRNAGTSGGASSAEHRPALAGYGVEGLDFLFVVTALSAVAGYAAWSVSARTIFQYGGKSLWPTVPFVVIGVARYFRLVYRRGGGDNPTRALLIDDPALLAVVLGWVAVTGWIIYGR
jgi:4-hydroxybenzoate polyprenyltransferase